MLTRGSCAASMYGCTWPASTRTSQGARGSAAIRSCLATTAASSSSVMAAYLTELSTL